MARVQGFSLIELMVVIAIVAVLAAIAVPSYKDYMLNAKIARVMPIISSIMDKQIMCQITTNGVCNAGTLGYAADPNNAGASFFDPRTVDVAGTQGMGSTAGFGIITAACANGGHVGISYGPGSNVINSISGWSELDLDCYWYLQNGVNQRFCSYQIYVQTTGSGAFRGGNVLTGLTADRSDNTGTYNATFTTLINAYGAACP